MSKPVCLHCGCREVFVTIRKTAEGVFDEEGNLEVHTHSEQIVAMSCLECKKDLPLAMIKNWR